MSEAKHKHRKQEKKLSPGNGQHVQIIWKQSQARQRCQPCRNVPEAAGSRGVRLPRGWLLGRHWDRNTASKDLPHQQSHVHGNPQQLPCYSPGGDSRARERTSGHSLKLEATWFTVAPSQTKPQTNLPNSLQLGKVVPLSYCITFWFVFLHLPS